MHSSIKFTKMQAAANDFILLDRRNLPSQDFGLLARNMCDRAFGIGSDGLIVFDCAADRPIIVDFFNPDGTPDVCGNGMRCLAGLLVTRGDREANTPFMLNAASSPIEVAACPKTRRAQVLLPLPSFDPNVVPTCAQTILINSPIEVVGHRINITALNTGSTHCVIIVSNLEQAAFEEIGAALECHQLFPQRTSVNLVEVIDRTSVKARVWERAIGETPACGTGACAIAVVCARLDLTDSALKVEFPGGILHVEITANGQPLLSGCVEIVYSGEYYLDI